MSRHYYNPQKKCFVSTNLKVWYSTLNSQSHLLPVSQRKVYLNQLVKLPFLYKKSYLLTRNPYDRLVSFYKDKFIQHIQSSLTSGVFDWQHGQRIFFEYLNVRDLDDHGIANKILATTFEEFVSILPKVYKRDEHLRPQYEQSHFYNFGFKGKLKYDAYFQVEDEQIRSKVKKEMGVWTVFKFNSTENVTCDIVWNKELRTLVNTLYVNDFKYFDYTMIEE